MRRLSIITAIVVMVGGVLLWRAMVATAVEPRTSRAAGATASESASDHATVEKKLREILKNQEQVLANQATILQKFDAVMEELRIIKVRATIRGGS